MKIHPSIGGGISTSSTSQSTLSGRPPLVQPQTTAHPLSVLLFGKRPPKLVDKRKHPNLKKALRRLGYIKDEVAEMLGRSPDDFSLELCEGNNACIDQDGQIAVGVELLEQHAEDDDFLVALLGHEMGHQPWTWPKKGLQNLKAQEILAIAREEEAKADRFAGRVLFELDADPKAICAFLERAAAFEEHAPRDYYPAQVRAQMIREAFDRRRRRTAAGRAVFGGGRTRALR